MLIFPVTRLTYNGIEKQITEIEAIDKSIFSYFRIEYRNIPAPIIRM